jgi:hypothetical protein
MQAASKSLHTVAGIILHNLFNNAPHMVRFRDAPASTAHLCAMTSGNTAEILGVHALTLKCR